MVKRGGDPARIEVCYINVEQNGARKSRSDLGLPEETAILLYPCRITVEKQPWVFAKSVLELRHRNYRFCALVVGDGPYLKWLKRFVKRHRLHGCVRFLGQQSNTRVRELMSVADCVFLPSKVEGISAVFYESLAEGVAAVGADIGGQRELVTPDCGVLVPTGDEDAEVRAYSQVLADLLDDAERRRAMGEAGRRRIRAHFTLDQMGERMDGLLEHARELARSSPRPASSEDEARAAALQAVRVASWPSPAPSSSAALHWRLRFLLLRVAAAAGTPVYRLGLRLGLHWVEGLRRRVAQALEPKPGG